MNQPILATCISIIVLFIAFTEYYGYVNPKDIHQCKVDIDHFDVKYDHLQKGLVLDTKFNLSVLGTNCSFLKEISSEFLKLGSPFGMISSESEFFMNNSFICVYNTYDECSIKNIRKYYGKMGLISVLFWLIVSKLVLKAAFWDL